MTMLSPSTSGPIRADSDTGALERVLVHRPGSELARVTSDSAQAMLFEKPVSMRAAQAEHTELRAALRAVGAEVIDIETALCRVVRDDLVRHRLIDGLCAPHRPAREWLHGLPDPRLVRVLIAGLAADEVPRPGRASIRRVHGSAEWLVRPVPNLMFSRDVFAVIGSGGMRGRMCSEVRRPESILVEALLGHHPNLRPWQCWADGDVEVEGGDVMALGDGVVVIGVGERTSRGAADTLARRLLNGGGAREVIAALIPPGGPFHLDLVLGTIDRDTLLVDVAVAAATRTVRWRFEAPPRTGPDLIEAIEAALRRRMHVIDAAAEDHGREWDRGTNVVAVRPGTVIAYAENRATNRRLERAGVEVWRIPGRALGAGRGGPRCLTAPLARRPLDPEGGEPRWLRRS
jgi:arginine deiminase